MFDRRPERIESLRRRLAGDGLDAFLVSSLPNIRYLTGFSGTSALVLVGQGVVLFLSDFRYRAQAALEVGDLARIAIDDGNAWERLFKLLGEYADIRTIGFESHIVTAQVAARLQNAEAAKAWKFEAKADVVERQRVVKSPEEIAAIRDAGRVATTALGSALGQVHAGQTETEVAGLLEAALRRHGSEGYPFPTIVASGERAALPHARTSDRVLTKGDFLLLDFGAIVGGYCSDITRTFVVGAAPDRRQCEVYDVVRNAQSAVLAGLRAGMTGRQADARARDVIAAAGMGDAFGHSLGHGVGLEVHEAPRLAKTVEDALPASAVVTVEPGVYFEGWGGVRIEDDVALEPDGATLLTEFPRELLTLS